MTIEPLLNFYMDNWTKCWRTIVRQLLKLISTYLKNDLLVAHEFLFTLMSRVMVLVSNQHKMKFPCTTAAKTARKTRGIAEIANHVHDKISLEKIMMISSKFSFPLDAHTTFPKSTPPKAQCAAVWEREETNKYWEMRLWNILTFSIAFIYRILIFMKQFIRIANSIRLSFHGINLPASISQKKLSNLSTFIVSITPTTYQPTPMCFLLPVL